MAAEPLTGFTSYSAQISYLGNCSDYVRRDGQLPVHVHAAPNRDIVVMLSITVLEPLARS